MSFIQSLVIKKAPSWRSGLELRLPHTWTQERYEIRLGLRPQERYELNQDLIPREYLSSRALTIERGRRKRGTMTDRQGERRHAERRLEDDGRSMADVWFQLLDVFFLTRCRSVAMFLL